MTSTNKEGTEFAPMCVHLVLRRWRLRLRLLAPSEVPGESVVQDGDDTPTAADTCPKEPVQDVVAIPHEAAHDNIAVDETAPSAAADDDDANDDEATKQRQVCNNRCATTTCWTTCWGVVCDVWLLVGVVGDGWWDVW